MLFDKREFDYFFSAFTECTATDILKHRKASNAYIAGDEDVEPVTVDDLKLLTTGDWFEVLQSCLIYRSGEGPQEFTKTDMRHVSKPDFLDLKKKLEGDIPFAECSTTDMRMQLQYMRRSSELKAASQDVE